VSDGIVLVRRCIGCGAISTEHPCVGACADRRLDLVDADEHAAASVALGELERTLGERQALVAELSRSVPAEHEWAALRARARATLRALPPVAAADAVTTWECTTCGRVEAPQECIGVCVRPELRMVAATEHGELVSRAEAVTRQLDRLAVPLRQLAWTTPGRERWRDTAQAVHAAARAALS
jgi:hypothetical protein